MFLSEIIQTNWQDISDLAKFGETCYFLELSGDKVKGYKSTKTTSPQKQGNFMQNGERGGGLLSNPIQSQREEALGLQQGKMYEVGGLNNYRSNNSRQKQEQQQFIENADWENKNNFIN